MAAMDRTANLRLQTPPRVLVAKDCTDFSRTMQALLDYFDRHTLEELIGQTVAINLGLMPILLQATGVPFQLTLGWIEQQGRARFKHDDDLIARFLALKEEAWLREGLPFHVWLTSPALEILDVTFAMNLGWAKSSEECARLIIYQSIHDCTREPIYHPTLVGDRFLAHIGVVAWGHNMNQRLIQRLQTALPLASE
jgi:hypothetical protein